MHYAFKFTSTHQDLLDAHAAVQTARSEMRPWIRLCVIGFGFAWIAGAIAEFSNRTRTNHSMWVPVVWMVLGIGTLWRFMVRPALERRRIRTNTPPDQPLALEFTDFGIHIEAEGVGTFDRTWDEFVAIEPAEKGVALGFSDGIMNWLPNRVFRDEQERNAFVEEMTGALTSREEKAPVEE